MAIEKSVNKQVHTKKRKITIEIFKITKNVLNEPMLINMKGQTKWDTFLQKQTIIMSTKRNLKY